MAEYYSDLIGRRIRPLGSTDEFVVIEPNCDFCCINYRLMVRRLPDNFLMSMMLRHLHSAFIYEPIFEIPEKPQFEPTLWAIACSEVFTSKYRIAPNSYRVSISCYRPYEYCLYSEVERRRLKVYSALEALFMKDDKRVMLWAQRFKDAYFKFKREVIWKSPLE